MFFILLSSTDARVGWQYSCITWYAEQRYRVWDNAASSNGGHRWTHEIGARGKSFISIYLWWSGMSTYVEKEEYMQVDGAENEWSDLRTDGQTDKQTVGNHQFRANSQHSIRGIRRRVVRTLPGWISFSLSLTTRSRFISHLFSLLQPEDEGS